MSAVIGSSLLVTIITTLASEIDQPNVSINVVPHYRAQPTNVNEPEVKFYEIIVNNIGKRQATNMTLSAYFNGSILNPTPIFSGEALSVPNVENISASQSPLIKGSLVRWDIPRFASGEMIIFNVSTSTSYSATKFDPYYVTAIFDEGSKTYPVFGATDIESGRFPNILAGRDEAQTTERLLITSIILSAIFFTIAIKYKKIKEIINERREGRKWNEIKFDLFLALPIAMLSSILIFYICEEIPLTALLHYLIIPPHDVTDGPSIATIVSYKSVDYRQGDLLLTAFIFWGISFFARSVLSYLIAKLLIEKFHKEKLINTLYLKYSTVFIMGVPLASAMMLFFSKSTYSISPVYLFFLFLVIDMIRMSLLVIVIPKITIKSNKLLNYGLNALSLVTGLLQLLLFVTLLRTWWTGEEIALNWSYSILMGSFFIFGSLQFIQMKFLKLREKRTSKWLLRAASISVGLMALWIAVLSIITFYQHPVLSIESPNITGSPVILTGIIVIVLNATYIGLARAMDIRKVQKVILTLDGLKTDLIGKDTFSKPCFLADQWINVTGQLKCTKVDSDRKAGGSETIPDKEIIGRKCIIVDNGGGRSGDKSKFPAETNGDGRFSRSVKTPPYVGFFKIKAHFEGCVNWDNEGNKNSGSPETPLVGGREESKRGWEGKVQSRVRNLKSRLSLRITVISPASSTDNKENNEELEYHTKLRNVSLSVMTGTMLEDGTFSKDTKFKPGQLITFEVKLVDTEENKPVSEQKDIRLMLYGEDTKKVTNPLPPTDDNGNIYTSIRAAFMPTDGCIFKASYPGNSVYANADSKVQSYSIKH